MLSGAAEASSAGVCSRTRLGRVISGVPNFGDGMAWLGKLERRTSTAGEFAVARATLPLSTDALFCCWPADGVRKRLAEGGGVLRDDTLLWRELLGTSMLFNSERVKASMDATDARLTLKMLVVSPSLGSVSFSTLKCKESCDAGCMGRV